MTYHINSSCVICENTVYKNGEIIFTNESANTPDFLFAIYKKFEINYSRFYKMDSLSKLGFLCTELLLRNSFTKENYKPSEIGLVFSNANSSLSTDIKYIESLQETPSPSLFVYTLPNIVTGEICIRNGFKGENAFFIFEKFNPVFLANYVSVLMDKNLVQDCICGWIDYLETGYKGALFLVEKNGGKFAVPFSIETMTDIFNV